MSAYDPKPTSALPMRLPQWQPLLFNFPWHSSLLGRSLKLSQTTILETEAVTI
jgi:hypothetical protein